jgi:flagellar biosynthesis protein FlhF
MIEVLAYTPEAPTAPTPPLFDALAEFRQQLQEIKQQVERRTSRSDRETSFSEPDNLIATTAEDAELDGGQWRVGDVLNKAGLLPVHVQKVLDQLHAQYGPVPPGKMGEEIGLARSVMARLWRRPGAITPNSTHVLIGPAGSGKTTCLCKWLTQTALVDGRMARVWRLDGATANMAESLSVYCEILGVPVERCWLPEAAMLREDMGFIDLPGVDWRKPEAVRELAEKIEQVGSPHVHLVLNGAYDTSILLAQQRAFSGLPVEDLIITHLDEESRWGKVWNLALGTNCSIRHFSTGQNIPGDFCEASAEMLFARQFPCK